ncbi:MAG: hypothetical protein ACTH6I_12355 [Vibrio litoralis]|uniref:hypothetical protein n=1 Tax=Vibrio litoralis TaxID=335972 RepID=UPI003F9D1897
MTFKPYSKRAPTTQNTWLLDTSVTKESLNVVIEGIAVVSRIAALCCSALNPSYGRAETRTKYGQRNPDCK